MNLKQIEKDWKARGFSFGIWEDAPGTEWVDYIHDVDELFMLIEGECELEIEGQKKQLQAGEEILIPAKAYHSVRNTGQTTNKWLYGYKN